MRLSLFVFVAFLGCSSANECPECRDEKCPELLATCQVNLDCACMADCIGELQIPGVDDCMTRCGVSERPPGFAALELCVATACPDSGDECATPADYQPPQGLVCEGTTAGLGGGTLADCGFDTGLPFEPDGPILQLQSADGTICARVERKNEGAGSLANTEWSLIGLRAGPLGEVADMAAADVCWYSSHHNFRDVAHAWSGSRRYDLLLLEDGHGGARKYDFYVFEEGPLGSSACSASIDGTGCIEGPIEMLPVSP